MFGTMLKLTTSATVLLILIASGQSLAGTEMAAGGNCDPASLARLPPPKRAMIEARCKSSKQNNTKREAFGREKTAWADAYFEDRPAMKKVYNDNAQSVLGCPGGLDDTDCDAAELKTFFHEAYESGDRIIWIDRSTSNSGGTYTCKRWEFEDDGAELADSRVYPC